MINQMEMIISAALVEQKSRVNKEKNVLNKHSNTSLMNVKDEYKKKENIIDG